MVLHGEWFECDDDVIRPTIRARVTLDDGTAYPVQLLVDTAADCTVLSADLLPALPPI